jgi:hypothetical protein
MFIAPIATDSETLECDSCNRLLEDVSFVRKAGGKEMCVPCSEAGEGMGNTWVGGVGWT